MMSKLSALDILPSLSCSLHKFYLNVFVPVIARLSDLFVHTGLEYSELQSSTSGLLTADKDWTRQFIASKLQADIQPVNHVLGFGASS